MALTAQTLSTVYRMAAAHVGDKWALDEGILDNAFGALPTVREFMQRFKSKRLGGANRFFWGLRLEKGGGEGSYNGYDTIDTTPPDTDTIAQVSTKEYWRPITTSFRDRDLVRGPRAFAEEFKIRYDQAIQRLMDDLNTHLQSDDGTGNSSKRVRGMKLWIASDPTDSSTSPGGVSQSSNSNWQNQFKNNSNTASNLLLDLRTLVTLCKSGSRGPDFVICNRSFRNCLEGKIGGGGTYYHNPVITDPGKPLFGKKGDGAIGTLFYRGIPIIEDENYTQYGTSTGPGEALFIDSNTFAFVNALANPSVKGMFEYVTPERATDQTAEVGGIRWHGELICLERRRNGIEFNVGADA